jgi:hypothetical protein
VGQGGSLHSKDMGDSHGGRPGVEAKLEGVVRLGPVLQGQAGRYVGSGGADSGEVGD